MKPVNDTEVPKYFKSSWMLHIKITFERWFDTSGCGVLKKKNYSCWVPVD